MGIEKIFYKKTLIGLRITDIQNGSMPLTDGREPLQIVALKHPKGVYLKAHAHKLRKRITDSLQECLFVRKGKVKLDLYGPDKKLFKNLFLRAGQLFLLMRGGIGIHILENAELFEAKNGPFKEDKILL